MDAKYSGFLEANPTFQERVEAFTSGLLTPDPKVVVLWAMEQGESCTVGELHQRVKEFVGDRLPISYPAMWSYCRGSGLRRGVLDEFGFVVNETEGAVSGPFAFEKTPAGAGFGDAIAARALWPGQRLKSVHRSMLRIFGAPQAQEAARDLLPRVLPVELSVTFSCCRPGAASISPNRHSASRSMSPQTLPENFPGVLRPNRWSADVSSKRSVRSMYLAQLGKGR